MKVNEIMTSPAVSISPEETVQVAARQLNHYNIGVLPVCTGDGKLCGVVTDRDLVVRCMAANRDPAKTSVREVMTNRVLSADGQMDVGVAAHLMGKEQIRRLPVVDNGKLCGMVSLGDLATREDCVMDAADALGDIASNVSERW